MENIKANILLGVGKTHYIIGNDLYQIVNEPNEHSLKIAVIQPIKVFPTAFNGVKENILGHCDGPLSSVEEYQTLKLKNTVNVGKNLNIFLNQIQTIIYVDPVTTKPKKEKRDHKGDLLVCDKQSVIKITNSNQYALYDFVVFRMYQDDVYVGKDVLETYPVFLLLSAEYDELVSYMKEWGLYEERWPFTHVWQDGLEFVHSAPIVQSPMFNIRSLGYFISFNSLYIRDKVIPRLGPKDYVLVVDWGTVYPATSLLISKAKYPKNIFWLANGIEEVDALKSQGVNAKLVSHNAFVNFKVFDIHSVSKEYDSIFCQSVIPFKRPLLAHKVKSIAYSTGSVPSDEYQQMIKDQQGDLFVGTSPEQVAFFMNQSRCGLSLSQAEGGNYATTEYLYCGLPVVTTPNLGGRNTYLNDSNSIMVEEETPEAVAAAVEYICNHPEKYDPIKIREGALKTTIDMLNTLVNEVLVPIFTENNTDPSSIPKDIEQIANTGGSNSKGRTSFQPEFVISRFND